MSRGQNLGWKRGGAIIVVIVIVIIAMSVERWMSYFQEVSGLLETAERRFGIRPC